MKLYELNDQIERLILDHVDRETGEIDEALNAQLDQLEMDRIEKIRQVMLYLKGEEAEAAGIGTIIAQLKKRQAVHTAHANWLRKYLEANTHEGDDVRDPRGRVYWKQSPGRVEAVEDLSQVDQRFVTWESVGTLDKNAAKKALKALGRGESIKGLRLAKPMLFTIE